MNSLGPYKSQSVNILRKILPQAKDTKFNKGQIIKCKITVKKMLHKQENKVSVSWRKFTDTYEEVMIPEK